ncbi:MAG: hypothetical protein IJ334_06265 [Clostridia bacterium]|nr:hypothetical protein [Clostridia bacterium]
MKKCCLALLLAGLLLAGCSGTPTESTAETAAETAAETMAEITAETAETEISYDPGIEAIDCGGQDFTILSRNPESSNYCYPYHEFLAEEITGEAINDAISERNARIADKYNLALVFPEVDYNNTDSGQKHHYGR